MKKTTTRLLALSLCMALTVLTGCGSSKNQFTPPENPYDSLELSEYVTLPDYSTYQTKALDVTVTDEQIEAEIESRLEAAATTEKITEGTVEKGDKVEISYHGTLEDGTTEDSMNSDSYTLTLGEANMIDGFQEAMYGATIGEPITANLKFPDPYEVNKELSGKKVTFEITVLSKEVTVPATLDDAFVKANSEAKNVDEFRTLVAEELKTEAEDSQRADYENEIFNQIVEESEVIKYPEEQVQAEMDKLDEQYKNLASQNGMEWEDVLENSLKLTQEEYEEELRVYGEMMTKHKLVTYALAKAEKVEFPIDEYNEILTNMMTYFGTETVEDFESQYGMSPQAYAESLYNSYGLAMSLTLQKTMDAIYEKLDKA